MGFFKSFALSLALTVARAEAPGQQVMSYLRGVGLPFVAVAVGAEEEHPSGHQGALGGGGHGISARLPPRPEEPVAGGGVDAPVDQRLGSAALLAVLHNLLEGIAIVAWWWW